MTTPALIAADPAGSWLVLEAVESDVAPAAWGREDYLEAVRLLAATHERFWGLAEDLSVFDWLSRALSTDFDIYVLSAVNAVERMVAEDRPRVITGSLEVLNTLEREFFTEEDIKILEIFAEQAALAIENSRLIAENVKVKLIQ